MADQSNTAETGTHSNPATAYIVEATKGVFVNDSLTRAVVLNTKLEKASRGVMLALATYANVQHHRAWASVPNLARRAGYSQRTTQIQLRELERMGYIRSIKDEVTRVTTTYQIVTQKLVQELCGTAAGPSSVAPAKTAPGGEKAAPGGEFPAPGGVQNLHPKKEGIEEGFESNREEGETRAHATPLTSRTTEPTFPALPPSVFENLPALNSHAVARSTALPTAPAPTPAPAPLPTSVSSNATATAHPQAATPAPSVDTLIDLPQQPSNSATSSNAAADTAPALPAPVAQPDTAAVPQPAAVAQPHTSAAPANALPADVPQPLFGAGVGKWQAGMAVGAAAITPVAAFAAPSPATAASVQHGATDTAANTAANTVFTEGMNTVWNTVEHGQNDHANTVDRPVEHSAAAQQTQFDPIEPSRDARYDHLRAGVEKGVLKPSVRSLMSVSAMSTVTARRYLAQMLEEGIIVKAGQGYTLAQA